MKPGNKYIHRLRHIHVDPLQVIERKSPQSSEKNNWRYRHAHTCTHNTTILACLSQTCLPQRQCQGARSNFYNRVITLWYTDRLMTCELGFVYFLSDLVVWSANPGVQNNPHLFPKQLSVSLPCLKIWPSDKRQTGKRKNAFIYACLHEYVMHVVMVSEMIQTPRDTKSCLQNKRKSVFSRCGGSSTIYLKR